MNARTSRVQTILMLAFAGSLTAAAFPIGSRLEGIEFALPASDEQLAHAALAVPVSRPIEFIPHLDRQNTAHMIATYQVGPEFSGYSATDITGVLTKRMRPAFRKAGLAAPDIESPLECDDPLCASAPRFHVTILLPRPDAYFVSLTVEVGQVRGTWSVLRPLNALNFRGSRPATTDKPSMVMTSVWNDLDTFAADVCREMLHQPCDEGAPR